MTRLFTRAESNHHYMYIEYRDFHINIDWRREYVATRLMEYGGYSKNLDKVHSERFVKVHDKYIIIIVDFVARKVRIKSDVYDVLTVREGERSRGLTLVLKKTHVQFKRAISGKLNVEAVTFPVRTFGELVDNISKKLEALESTKLDVLQESMRIRQETEDASKKALDALEENFKVYRDLQSPRLKEKTTQTLERENMLYTRITYKELRVDVFWKYNKIEIYNGSNLRKQSEEVCAVIQEDFNFVLRIDTLTRTIVLESEKFEIIKVHGYHWKEFCSIVERKEMSPINDGGGTILKGTVEEKKSLTESFTEHAIGHVVDECERIFDNYNKELREVEFGVSKKEPNSTPVKLALIGVSFATIVSVVAMITL